MDPFQRFSFDLPFLIRQSLESRFHWRTGVPRPTDDAVILYVDEESTRRLEQNPGTLWSRALHARLLDRLTEDGARAVLFDVVFDTETRDDPAFAAAIARNGRTILGATIFSNSEQPLTPDESMQFLQVGLKTERLSKKSNQLYKSGAGWGLLWFRPVDADYGVRRLFVGKRREGFDPWPAASWQLALLTGADLPADDDVRFARRWLNYYGPARTVESLSYDRALREDGGVPPGYFKDRVVFIGAGSQLGTSGRKTLDEFSTPWSHFAGRAYTPGTELHATAYLNLLHHDWLGRVAPGTERWVIILLGIALGALRWLRPWWAVSVGLAAGIGVFGVSCVLQWHSHLWWNWSVPALVQTPLAVIMAVASRYYFEEGHKRKLRAAFGFYLSPELASQIAEKDFSLKPGGKKVLATLLFTDLEGFTALSEKLGDSERLGEELSKYFTRTTDEILAENGTVIKFVGDAVYAAWGAPLPQEDQAERAVRAAWRLAQVSDMEVEIPQPDGTIDKVRIRTRIGIHTGEALAGNLGSAQRFDYTLIGDAVNLASRLESANKQIGTTILLSDSTAQRLGGKFLLRRIGSFRVKGKARTTIVHELLGLDPNDRAPWLDVFERAMSAWDAGDFENARTTFATVAAIRGARDGVSEYYILLLEALRVPPSGWDGVITLDEK